MVKKRDLSDADYQRLGKAVERIIQRDYVDLALHWPRLIKVNLIKGIFAGFGGVLGATILIGLLIWLLSVFDEIPLVGRFFENLRQTIDQ